MGERTVGSVLRAPVELSIDALELVSGAIKLVRTHAPFSSVNVEQGGSGAEIRKLPVQDKRNHVARNSSDYVHTTYGLNPDRVYDGLRRRDKLEKRVIDAHHPDLSPEDN